MIRSLTGLDIFLIACYFLAVLYVGWRSGQKENNEGFLLAERQLNPWTSAATICASKIGAGLFLTYIAYVYIFGISAIWSFFGFTAGYILYYIFARRLKKLADTNQYYTLSDYFFQQYGRLSGFASALALFIVYVIGFAAQLVGGGKVLGQLVGTDYWISLTIMTVVMLIYIFIGGFNAVVQTDVLQYMAIVVLTIIITVFLSFNIGQLQLDNLSFTLNTSLALFLGSVIVPFASADLWQRVYATKGEAQAQRSLLYAMIMYLIFGLILTFLGYMIKSKIVTQEPDLAFVIGFQQLLPTGLIGFSVVILYAAIMSTADTYLFTAASIAIQDFLGKAKNVQEKDKLVYGIRWISLLIGTSSYFVALFFPNLVQIGFLWISLNVAIGVIVVISWLFQKIDDTLLFIGFGMGTVTTLATALFFTNENLIFVSLLTGPIFVLLFFLLRKVGILKNSL
jgi:Na+/proline symporter